MPDLLCFDITLDCPQSRTCVVLIELLQVVKDLYCVLVCVDLAYEAVVIDSISFKIIVSSFFLKPLLSTCLLEVCNHVIFHKKSCHYSITILFRNLLAQHFMKWSGVFIKLQKVPQNNENLNNLFGQKWQLFLWHFMMFQATFQEQDFFFSTRKRPRRTQDELDPDERRKRFLERNRWVQCSCNSFC